MSQEPKIHSHIDDELPDTHPLAWETVFCVQCRAMLHAANNECMQTWVETGKGAYCLKDFMTVSGGEVLDDDLALPEDK
jgi:hypothetical protein